jgi:hypothetical protein
MVPVPGNPFGVVTTSDGAWSFVSLGSSIAVLSEGSGIPRLVRQIAMPGRPLGESLTHDGHDLLVADGSGLVVVNVEAAEHGSANALVGQLTSPFRRLPPAGAIEVTASPDDRYAFVTLEYKAELAVFDLGRALESGFGSSDFVGDVPLQTAPVGMAIAPSGRWLYATSETQNSGGEQNPGDGTLSVIDVARAETDPAAAVEKTVDAGCGPVRVVTSSDGHVVWVTARESDTLLGFSAPELLTDPSHALIAKVRVGEAPVGLALVDSGRRIIVANSNRFGATGQNSSLAVVDTEAAMAHQPALLGTIRAGLFPREMTVLPGQQILLVTNFSSDQVELVHLAGLG